MAPKVFSQQIPDERKTQELILYISTISEGDENFGAVKLNKLLFYSDFLAYLRYGKSITGQEYQALRLGPAPRRFLPIRKKMVEDGSLTVIERDHYGHSQQKPLARRNADLSAFSAEEIALVDSVICSFHDANAKEVSDWSHEFAGWQFAREGETIPYCVALVVSRRPTPNEISRGLELEPLASECLG